MLFVATKRQNKPPHSKTIPSIDPKLQYPSADVASFCFSKPLVGYFNHMFIFCQDISPQKNWGFRALLEYVGTKVISRVCQDICPLQVGMRSNRVNSKTIRLSFPPDFQKPGNIAHLFLETPQWKTFPSISSRW